MSKPPRVAIYARVSTADQSVGMQLRDLEEFVAGRKGWTLVDRYIDEGVSGTRESRPQIDRLMSDARRRRFDMVLVWRFDRFARSVRHLVEALHEFKHLGIDFVSYQENIDTSSPLGEAVFTIIAAMAKLERDIIAERVRAGLRRARESGKRLGRPPVRLDRERVLALRGEGLSIRQIAAQVGASKSKVGVLVRECGAETPEDHAHPDQGGDEGVFVALTEARGLLLAPGPEDGAGG